MEKVNENTITISEKKMNLLNDMAYTELILLNMVHGNDPAVGEMIEANYNYGKTLIDVFVDSSKMKVRNRMKKLITISEEELNDVNELTYHGLMLKMRMLGIADENLDILLNLNKEYGEILIDNIKDVAKMRRREKCTSTHS